MKPANVLLFSCLAVVVWDAAASVGSLVLGVPYANASVGSFLIYLVAGFLAARIKSCSFSLVVGLAAGITDATLGWGVSWVLGPGRLPAGSFTATQLLSASGSVIVVAMALAGIGGLVGGFFR